MAEWIVEAETLETLENGFYTIGNNGEPIVRCRDCKWFNDIGCAMNIVDDSDKPKDDDYCSFGERGDEVKELTKEEAITVISDIRSEYNLSCDPKEVPKYHALSMAIEALRDKLRTEEMQSNW